MELKLETTTIKFDDDTTVEVPTAAIRAASDLSYDEDEIMVVGKIQGEWAIRGYEDPKSDTMENGFKVDASGVIN